MSLDPKTISDNTEWPQWQKFVLSELENNSDGIERVENAHVSLETRFNQKVTDDSKQAAEIRQEISDIKLKMVERMVHGGIGGGIVMGILELIKFLNSQHETIQKVLPK